MGCNYIYIFKGDDTNWNGENFLTVNITPQPGVDLSTMTGEFILGAYHLDNIDLSTGTFKIDLSKTVTGSYSYGPINGTIRILDNQGRVKTVCNTIPFYITNKVIVEQDQTLTLDLPQGSPVTIDIAVGNANTSVWGQITGDIEDQTDLQESLAGKVSKSGDTMTGPLSFGDFSISSDDGLAKIEGAQYGLRIDTTSGLGAALYTANGVGNVLSTLDVKSTYSSTGTDPVNGTAVASAISTKQDTLSESQLSAVNSGIDSTKVGQIATNANDISAIEGKIPAQASSENQLADKNFVNSSIATNTANFIGTFENVSTLEAYSGTVTNNDYAFVINSVVEDNGGDWATFSDLDAYDKSLLTNFDYAWVVNGSKFDLYRFDIVEQEWVLRVQDTHKNTVTLNTAYNRYKATVGGSTVTWAYEYTLNNSSFTANQWAAINSGITSGLVTQIGTNTTAIAGKQDTLVSGTNIKTVNNNSLLGNGNISIDSLPSQTGNSGKVLTTDGTDSSWTTLEEAGAYTRTNLIAGNNISITQVQQPVIDENTLALYHFNNNLTDTISGENIDYAGTATYTGGKFDECVFPNSAFAENRNWFDCTANSFTIDLWFYGQMTIYLNANTYPTTSFGGYVAFGASSATIYRILAPTGGAFDVTYTYPSGVTVSDKWNHFAVVNDLTNNTMYFFLNGTVFHTRTSTPAYWAGYKYFNLGIGNGNRIDELRISNVARWTSNFTPFSAPYTTGGAPQYQINNTQDISGKQDTLVSGTNIKTINSTSLLGSGNISIDSLPSQTGNSGKYLTTNGTTASWSAVDSLPSQTGNSGKVLTTNGTTASWTRNGTIVYSQLLPDTTHFAVTGTPDANNILLVSASLDSKIQLKPDVANTDVIVLKFRYRYTTDTTSLKHLVSIPNGGYPDSTYPFINCYTKYDIFYPGKQTIGSRPYANWRNLTLTLNKVAGSLTFYQTDDNNNVTDNWSGYTSGTGRDTNDTWFIRTYSGESNSDIQVDLTTLKLIEDGVEYSYLGNNTYYEELKIGNNLQVNNNTLSATSSATTLTWYKGNTGATLTIPDTTGASSVKVYKNGLLLESGFTEVQKDLYTGGSSTQYLTLASTSSLSTANTWEIQAKIKFHPQTASNAILIGSSGADYKTPIFLFHSNEQSFIVSYNGSSWAPTVKTTLVLADNDIVSFRAGFDGSQYYLYTTNVTQGTTGNAYNVSSSTVHCSAPFMILNQSFGLSQFYDKSDFYMADFKIIVDNVAEFDGNTAVAGTDFTNTNCTVTQYQEPSDPENYNLSSTTVTFATPLVATDKIAVEVL